MAMIGVGCLILSVQRMAAPIRIYHEQKTAIEHAAASDIMISQVKGYGDNIASVFGTQDFWLVLIRELIVINRGERDQIVSLNLWLPLAHDGVTLSPQVDPPTNPGKISLRHEFSV
jgi:hypothetical protein